MPGEYSGEVSDGARMELGPDSVHEDDGGYYLDCPKCGSPVTFSQIIEHGECTGSLDGEETEVEADDERLQDVDCTASLTLELCWDDEPD